MALSSAEKQRRWRSNPENRAKEAVRKPGQDAAYYQRNAARILEQRRLAYLADPDRVKARVADWKRRKPEKVREQNRRRDALKAGSSVAPVDYAAIRARDGDVCHLCGERVVNLSMLHFDHVVPLARGGAHSPENIRVSHALCNLQKGAKVVQRTGF